MRKDCSIILKSFEGWPQKVKTMQKNWIGKSVGAEVNFEIKGFDKPLQIFTTRPDTLYGVTYMVMSPEHPFIDELVSGTEYEPADREYQDNVKR